MIEHEIAELVNKYGGTTYYVGGFVRDRLMGIENKDVDIEVHGISPEKLKEILDRVGEPLSFGSSFGVYSLRGSDLDIAMPRMERAVGGGHRDFEVMVDPFIGVERAAQRRDFTMNALMENVLTGELVDCFGGRADLEAGVIRHVDAGSFVEDPLRAFRAAQFAARFGFEIAAETIELCKTIDVSTLSRERVEEELKKALLKGRKPSLFFENLREMGQLSGWFSELEPLIGLEQDPLFHPEGDVWTHTMEVLDRAAEFRDDVSDAYSFMMFALTHDLGKTVTTEFVKGRIHAYNHEIDGMPIVEKLIDRIISENSVKRYVRNMVPLHMRPNVAAYNRPSLKSTNRMFDAAVAPKDLVYFAMCDKPVLAGNEKFEGDTGFLFERLAEYEQIMAKPHVTGKDLIDAGLEPGEDFSDVLAHAHKLRLAGIEKESALRQTLAYARKKYKM